MACLADTHLFLLFVLRCLLFLPQRFVDPFRAFGFVAFADSIGLALCYK